MIILKLLQLIQPNHRELIEVVNLGGASHAEKLGKLTEHVIAKILGTRSGYVLLDSDKAGNAALPDKIKSPDAQRRWVQSGNIWWRTLPLSAEASAAFDAAGITEAAVRGMLLEDCYPSDVRARAIKAHKYNLSGPRDFVRTKADLLKVTAALSDDVHKYYLFKPDKNHKKSFAEWLISQGLERSDILSDVLKEMFKAM